MRDGRDGGGRFIPADTVGVHILSLLESSRIAHDHATDNHYPDQHNTQYTIHSPTVGSNQVVF